MPTEEPTCWQVKGRTHVDMRPPLCFLPVHPYIRLDPVTDQGLISLLLDLG